MTSSYVSVDSRRYKKEQNRSSAIKEGWISWWNWVKFVSIVTDHEKNCFRVSKIIKIIMFSYGTKTPKI